jgi:uncharacterized protein YggE
MRRVLVTAILAFSLFSLPRVFAQPQVAHPSPKPEENVIKVHRDGTVDVKPDLGILVMSIQSSSPISEEAVAANADKAKAVDSALAALGFAPTGYKIGSVVLGQGGGLMSGPSQPEIIVYEATQSIYVFLEGADLSDMTQLTKKSAAVIEALRKAGAVPGMAAGPRMMPQMLGGLIIYTVKHPEQYERQALQKAIARARQAAQDIAAGLNVQITGVRNVQSTFLGGGDAQRSQISLEGLPYRYYSMKSAELEITADATVDFKYK